MRFVHLLVIGALIMAASFVYKIKFDSTLQAEKAARLRGELRRERDAIATLRAEWARLDNPARIQTLAQRHLPLKTIDARQFDDLSRLPEKPPAIVPPTGDPIGAMIEPSEATGTVPGSQ